MGAARLIRTKPGLCVLQALVKEPLVPAHRLVYELLFCSTARDRRVKQGVHRRDVEKHAGVSHDRTQECEHVRKIGPQRRQINAVVVQFIQRSRIAALQPLDNVVGGISPSQARRDCASESLELLPFE